MQINSITENAAIIKGKRPLKTLVTGTFDIPATIKATIPIGGVTAPSACIITTKIPNQIGSIPIDSIAGYNKGIVNIIIVI